MWRVWAPTGQQTCTRVPQSALLMPLGHLLARVLAGGCRRAAVALRRAALQAQRQASGDTDAFRGRWTWRLLLRCDLTCREATSLRSRDFAKPEVAYCANASVGAHAKKQGNQESQPRLGNRRPYLAARLNAQSTLRQWAVGACSTGVARAHGGAHAQPIALLAH